MSTVPNLIGHEYLKRMARPAVMGCLIVVFLLNATRGLAQSRIDFGSQIKPILSDNCFTCHGPDEAQRATDFRLDLKSSALDPDYAVIVPNESDSSLLVERIMATDPDEVMPPADHRKRLTDQQKQLLVKWIDQGADWKDHWAFRPLVRNSAPEPRRQSWPINDVDRYILQRLEQEQLNPAPPADQATLLRRLSFDLIGLPPSPKEVAEFNQAIVSHGFETAYRRAVDRLLASPHFGERLAVYWLDLVRYADTVGYHGDQNVSISPYRDYVIDSFNQNLPFDQFTREQLAGDLLNEPTQSQLIASGYNRLGMMSAEGGVQPEEYLNKYASDRVRTTASVWLGITLGCAECHDHKFDPFSSREFYEFSAFFADIKEQGLYAGAHESGKWGPTIDVADEPLAQLLVPVDRQISELKSGIVASEQIRKELAAWEQAFHETDPKWKLLQPEEVATTPQLKIKQNDDQSILIRGENPKSAVYAVGANVEPGIRALRLEALPHKSLPLQGPGRSGGGNFVVSELLVLRGDQSEHLELLAKDTKQWPDALRSKIVSLVNASATFEQTQGGDSHPDKKWSAASAIDNDQHGNSWGWAILPEVGKPHELVVQLASDQSLEGPVTIVIRQQHENGPHLLGHFRISESQASDARASRLAQLPQDVQNVIQIDSEKRSSEQRQALTDYYLTIAPLYDSVREGIAELESKRKKLVDQHSRSTLVTVAVEPRPIRVLARGDWMDETGDLVVPSVPEVLGRGAWEGGPNDPNGSRRATRLDLANWIVGQDNPLASRVFVNRIWRLLFGNGISNVLDDFGSQGEPPSHPELLDYLAVRFVDSGWDIKQLIRTLVLSQTYRQSSSLRDDLKEIDPENRLIARQSRFRLDAEFIRDHALAVSGLLVEKSGGRSTMPYQPPGLYRHLNFPTRTYQASTGNSQYRRGLYTHWQRQFLHPAMKTFDAPAREECTAARPRSSTPLAALVLLNDPSYVEAARALADLLMLKETDTSARLDALFERAFSRSANSEERQVLTELLESQLRYFEAHAEEANELISIGQSATQADENRLASASVAERAAWTSVCRAIINMHEFVLRK